MRDTNRMLKSQQIQGSMISSNSNNFGNNILYDFDGI